MTVVAGGSDSSGYLNSAKLLAQGRARTDLRIPPEFAALQFNRRHFTPAGFDSFVEPRTLAPTYPSGLPLHLAAGASLLGWETGPFAVQLLAALAAIGLCYLNARQLGIDCTLAVAGALILAVFPVFIFTSIQTLSDTLATAWSLAAIYAALRARATNGWAGICGGALAVAVLVRPTNLVLAPALVVLLGFDARRVVLFALGGLPGAVWLALYNHHLYGSALATGYRDVSTAFALQYIGPSLANFAPWLARFLPLVIFALPLAALFHRGTRSRALFALALVAAANFGVHLIYAVSGDVWWYLRFVLPGVAALILAGMLGVEAIAGGLGLRWPRAFRPTMALGLMLWAGCLSWYWCRQLHVFMVPVYERAYEEAAQLVRQDLPENALIVCGLVSGSIYYYTSMPTLVFDTVSPVEFNRYATSARQAGRSIFAVIFDIEEEAALRQNCPGNWRRMAKAGNIGIWQLE